MKVSDVIQSLLQHVGMMCVHQLNNEVISSPLGTLLLQHSSVDAVYLGRCLDVLSRGVAKRRHTHVITALIGLQVKGLRGCFFF